MKGNESQKVSFSEAVARLVADAATLPPVIDHPGILQGVKNVCDTLGIARCEANIEYKSINHEMDEGLKVFFSSEDHDKCRKFSFREDMPDGNVAVYTVYPYEGAPDWSDETIDDIEVFLSALFVINGRSRMITIVERLAFHDEELNVFNLNYLMKTLSELIKSGEAKKYCVCRCNLKNFSAINGKIGRVQGTAVMKRFANKLAEVIGESGFVSRLGGDNFIILFKKELLATVRAYLIGTNVETNFRGLPEVNVSAYAGYLMISDDYITFHHVLERIDTAFVMAKYKLKIPYVMFDERFKKERDNIKSVESMFFDAIDNEEFLVYYQPKVDLKENTLSGAEALCRWDHAGTLIPPGQFIPVLEQSNNICVLDFYMLEHVCKDMRRWIDSGYPVVKVSVNMSRVHLGDDKLSDTIRAIIDKYNVPHEYIEIELTETTTDIDFTELKHIVSLLHEEGISTSVDDFGVGYSSLNLIRDLPWDVLKIDKSFLPDDSDENRDAKNIMLMHVISMAHQLGLECIVEGVETSEQVKLLLKYDCYRAQGYYFDRPLPVEKYEERLTGRYVYEMNVG